MGPLFGPVLWVCLVAASYSDLRTRRVSNGLNASIAVLGLGAQLHRSGLEGLLDATLGVGAAFLLVIVPFALRLYRGGDAKLVMALGAWLGPAGAALTFVFGAALGGVVALGVLIRGGPALRRAVRASLEAAARTATVPQVEADRDARVHVPMALAFALGAVVASIWR